MAALAATAGKGLASPPVIVPPGAAQQWQKVEFVITNVPASVNPFDPEQVRLDATFTFPSGKQLMAPAFWSQDYRRALAGGTENDTPVGAAGWRLRFTPPEAGAYTLTLVTQTNHQTYGAPVVMQFAVSARTPPARFGYVSIGANQQYFQTGDGRALPLNGEDVAWPSSRGTYDYDTWFAAMQKAGENFGRIWMSPFGFGLEDTAGALDHYALGPAWELDYVLQSAEQKGIYLQLTLDFHGMFVTQPDYWGSGNYWPQNPYNASNGGPCATPNAFFTNATAKAIYQKRLRYLIGRYGYSQNVLAWEFFNEIDNDYAFLNANDVAAWHKVMGDWMRTNDNCHHLLTTSLTYASSHPELWNLPELDFCSEHSYLVTASPFTIASDAQTFLKTYHKPLMIGEFGTDWQGWNRANDPYLRGFREGLWTGALGGSAGASMAWWWQNIDSENDYGDYAALTAILGRTSWGTGAWTNITLQNLFLNATGQRGAHESLVYMAAAQATFPTGATNASLPVQHAKTLTSIGWANGRFYAEWYDPQTAALVGESQSVAANGRLTLPLPDFTVDLAGVIYPAPVLAPLGVNENGEPVFSLFSENGGRYAIEKSSDLIQWDAILAVTNDSGLSAITIPNPLDAAPAYFRAVKN
jgi:hypothetical protein